MNEDGKQILRYLAEVAAERNLRAGDTGLARRVAELKRFQHTRFAQTYNDLSANPGNAAAVAFFLDELYGPHDFSQRDGQFARIVPALVRLFPADIVKTVRVLAELHALSEKLDTCMAKHFELLPLDMPAYKVAWQRTGLADDRDRQIQLMLEVGQGLWGYTKNPLIRHSLRLMRGPAQAAGLGSLQRFLESGFETFKGLPDPASFLHLIAQRERALATSLFNDDTPA
jgi:hypothetical protein